MITRSTLKLLIATAVLSWLAFFAGWLVAPALAQGPTLTDAQIEAHLLGNLPLENESRHYAQIRDWLFADPERAERIRQANVAAWQAAMNAAIEEDRRQRAERQRLVDERQAGIAAATLDVDLRRKLIHRGRGAAVLSITSAAPPTVEIETWEVLYRPRGASGWSRWGQRRPYSHPVRATVALVRLDPNRAYEIATRVSGRGGDADSAPLILGFGRAEREAERARAATAAAARAAREAEQAEQRRLADEQMAAHLDRQARDRRRHAERIARDMADLAERERRYQAQMAAAEEGRRRIARSKPWIRLVSVSDSGLATIVFGEPDNTAGGCDYWTLLSRRTGAGWTSIGRDSRSRGDWGPGDLPATVRLWLSAGPWELVARCGSRYGGIESDVLTVHSPGR